MRGPTKFLVLAGNVLIMLVLFWWFGFDVAMVIGIGLIGYDMDRLHHRLAALKEDKPDGLDP